MPDRQTKQQLREPGSATPVDSADACPQGGSESTPLRSGPLHMLSPSIAQLEIKEGGGLAALAREYLNGSTAKVSGVISDGSVKGDLIERNTLKTGRMLYFPQFPADERVRALYAFLLEKCQEYLRCTGGTADIEIERCWIIDQRGHDYQVLHSHVPNVLSGIIYLEIPQGVEQGTYPDGILTLIENNPFVILPIEGTMYIWPAYMLHTVYPFRGAGRRLAISFNVKDRHFNRGSDVFYKPTYVRVTPEQYFSKS